MTDTPTIVAQIEAQPFQREERYIVIKRKHLSEAGEHHIRDMLGSMDVRTVECVVVEHDWPEYETVWGMIEQRVSPAIVTALRQAEAAPAFIVTVGPCTHAHLAAMPTVGQMSCLGCRWQRPMTPEEYAHWNPPFEERSK